MSNKIFLFIFLIIVLISCKLPQETQQSAFTRELVEINNDWQTFLVGEGEEISIEDFSTKAFLSVEWKPVDIPHNWDQYYGYRREKHGNLHGTAWYRKELLPDSLTEGKKHFLFFEGVGSYATVWVNGQEVGHHKGGRTSFTLDITDQLTYDRNNLILVKAEHPPFIADLPWVCGGCSGEWGFSEGSQPLGIFRPVSLLVTNDVKVEPFGVHIWNDQTISEKQATLNVKTEIKNYGDQEISLKLLQEFLDVNGKIVVKTESEQRLNASEIQTITQELPVINKPNLWSPENPYLYQLKTTIIDQSGVVVDQIQTDYGIRWISFPIYREGEDNRFFLNGKPYFLNGTCEYEHNMGRSHSFTDLMVEARVNQMISAGFNSFREAHQPHNLRYQKHLDKRGILFWSQFSAHIWYDTPEFKENFKNLLRDWIKERRNSPSVILWGLQNESTIPDEFARECLEIVREMDPTTSSQRLLTTCNGGTGTDWNVIQNWSGTYGGDPFNYDEEMKKDLLNGEYGAWRTTDLHTEGEFNQDGIYSENRFSQLMEIKVREAESVRDEMVGQYQWLFTSHENPGRIQNGEAYRDIDRVGPVNYKGLFTVWSEPTDAYYMYRANYAPKETEPMVYIVSHNWPNRWFEPGVKNGIDVYSNCDEVELFNAVNGESLGKKKHPGTIGEHFQWNHVEINYNVLKAVGFIDGKEVAQDLIILPFLPEAVDFQKLKIVSEDVLQPDETKNYLYRVNAGGPQFTDHFGNTWQADVQKMEESNWGSTNWTDNFKDLPPFYASQRRTFDPIKNTANWDLFQTYRYGQDQLSFHFPVENGDYEVELFFVEPWYGTGGGLDCENWRNFDVAINGEVVEENLDIWKEVGHDTALKKTYEITASDKEIKVHFPKVRSGQAVISAIAISGKGPVEEKSPTPLVKEIKSKIQKSAWLDIGHQQYTDSDIKFTHLPYEVFGANYYSLSTSDFTSLNQKISLEKESNIFIFQEENATKFLTDTTDWKQLEEPAINSKGIKFTVYRKQLRKNEELLVINHMKNGFAIIPTYEMGEGEEQWPSEKLEFEQAFISGKFSTENFKKSDYIFFEDKEEKIIEFEVNPGLAGIHLMRFRYMNMSEAKDVRLEIIAPNGAVVRDDLLNFPTANEKWKILNTTTGGYINAGKYTIRLTTENSKDLWLESFEFQ